eukprot:TRINITY_DN14429_c0_g1_i1.p1 TRINITY_DN14429_c0_g1~~TRINITY_DN14429_c0_g1_i1.p1  ORF type:complete len:403 (+),score=54.02 TRINITY_DN14429_c0_g1_i1:35-1243(+)
MLADSPCLGPVPALDNQPAVVIFTGGTALNVHMCKTLRQEFTRRITYVVPVSDDGGSTSEILRAFGGPAIGDIRARLLRVANDATPECRAVIRLLSHRLPSTSEDDAQEEWRKILRAQHPLWEEITEPYRETIRAFLIHFNTSILKVRPDFDLRNGSIGNFYLSGAKLFFGSLDTCIFWFSRIAGVPSGTRVVPAAHPPSSQRYCAFTLAADLTDGTTVVGQNAISHPNESPKSPTRFNRNYTAFLPSPVKRIYYSAGSGEAHHSVHPTVPPALAEASVVVYSHGSLFTSLLPCLILGGVGEAVAKSGCPKVLLLNAALDRETTGMTAVDFVTAVTEGLNRYGALSNPPTVYISHLFYVAGGTVEVNVPAITALGVTPVLVPGERGEFSGESLVSALSALLI